MKEFVLSDESINNRGFKVLTGGISLKRFLQNPVMYFNHDRNSGVIGRWENIHIQGGKLFATPVFDMKDQFASKIASKVEDGFIKAASIGIDECKSELVKGESIITSCSLYECSVCDIPSNENALALYYNDQVITDLNEIIKLSNNNNMNDLELIIEALGLQGNATIDDIVVAIKILKQSVNPETDVDKAVEMKFVSEYERKGLLALSFSNPVAFSSYMEERKKEVINKRTEEGNVLIRKAMLSGTINNDREGKVKSFWLSAFVNDFEATKHVLESLPPRTSIASLIDVGNQGKSSWTLNDYRRNAPQELKSNPQLYQTLLEQEQAVNNNKH